MAEITPSFIQSQIQRGRKHCLVLLKKGANRDQDDATAARLQMEHLTHLFGRMQEGALVVNGPVMGHGELVGVSIYDSADRAEVEAIVRADPAVAAGRLTYEILDWFSIDGMGYPISGRSNPSP